MLEQLVKELSAASPPVRVVFAVARVCATGWDGSKGKEAKQNKRKQTKTKSQTPPPSPSPQGLRTCASSSKRAGFSSSRRHSRGRPQTRTRASPPPCASSSTCQTPWPTRGAACAMHRRRAAAGRRGASAVGQLAHATKRRQPMVESAGVEVVVDGSEEKED